ncbi:OmpA family protein [Ferrimonas marina]|uniref:OmpA family protein n=1 Tax=Ferrimonas marina TaxID=299255 RepID=A0A1M5VXG7_9GAMM|nr:OmpA family protein [Ferrimonas marina]SHH79870.1 OmpA family protein [Ferrimonas marina]
MKGLIGALALLCPFALAATDETPWYLSIGIGGSHWQDLCPGSEQADRCDDTDTQWDISAGWHFIEPLAVEVGHVDLGGTEWSRNEQLGQRLSGDGLRFALRGQVPLPHQLVVSGELGGLWYDSQATDANGSASDSGIAPFIGVGLDYQIKSRWQLGARIRQYQDLEVSALSARSDVTTYSLQLKYRFGPMDSPIARARVALPSPLPASTTLVFGFNSYHLDEAARDQLGPIGQYMQSTPGAQAEIIGYTDQQGDSDYNLLLGQRRAEAVKLHLQQAWQIPEERLFTTTRGSLDAGAKRSDSDRKATISLFLD